MKADIALSPLPKRLFGCGRDLLHSNIFQSITGRFIDLPATHNWLSSARTSEALLSILDSGHKSIAKITRLATEAGHCDQKKCTVRFICGRLQLKANLDEKWSGSRSTAVNISGKLQEKKKERLITLMTESLF